jgi:hypothetical protein
MKDKERREDWMKEFSFLDHDDYFICRLCHVWVDGDGTDILRHSRTKKHTKREKSAQNVVTLDALCVRRGEKHPSVVRTLAAFHQCGLGVYTASSLMNNKMFKSSIVSSLGVWPSSSWLSEAYEPEIFRLIRDKQFEMIEGKLVGLAIDESPNTFGRKVITMIMTTWKDSFVSNVKVLPPDASVCGESVADAIIEHLKEMHVEPHRFIGGSL